MTRHASGFFNACALGVFVLILSASAVSAAMDGASTGGTTVQQSQICKVGEDGKETCEQDKSDACTPERQQKGECKPKCPTTQYQTPSGGTVTCHNEVNNNCEKRSGVELCTNEDTKNIIDGSKAPKTPVYGGEGSQSGKTPPLSEQVAKEKAARDAAQQKMAEAQKTYDNCHWYYACDSQAKLDELNKAKADYATTQQRYADQVRTNEQYLKDVGSGKVTGDSPEYAKAQTDYADAVKRGVESGAIKPPVTTVGTLGDYAAALRENYFAPSSFSGAQSTLGPSANIPNYGQFSTGFSDAASGRSITGGVGQSPTGYAGVQGFAGGQSGGLGTSALTGQSFGDLPSLADGTLPNSAYYRLGQGLQTLGYGAPSQTLSDLVAGSPTDTFMRLGEVPGTFPSTIDFANKPFADIGSTGEIPLEGTTLTVAPPSDVFPVSQELARFSGDATLNAASDRPALWSGVAEQLYGGLGDVLTGKTSVAELWDKTLKNAGAVWNRIARESDFIPSGFEVGTPIGSSAGDRFNTVGPKGGIVTRTGTPPSSPPPAPPELPRRGAKGGQSGEAYTGLDARRGAVTKAQEDVAKAQQRFETHSGMQNLQNLRELESAKANLKQAQEEVARYQSPLSEYGRLRNQRANALLPDFNTKMDAYIKDGERAGIFKQNPDGTLDDSAFQKLDPSEQARLWARTAPAREAALEARDRLVAANERIDALQKSVEEQAGVPGAGRLTGEFREQTAEAVGNKAEQVLASQSLFGLGPDTERRISGAGAKDLYRNLSDQLDKNLYERSQCVSNCAAVDQKIRTTTERLRAVERGTYTTADGARDDQLIKMAAKATAQQQEGWQKDFGEALRSFQDDMTNAMSTGFTMATTGQSPVTGERLSTGERVLYGGATVGAALAAQAGYTTGWATDQNRIPYETLAGNGLLGANYNQMEAVEAGIALLPITGGVVAPGILGSTLTPSLARMATSGLGKSIAYTTTPLLRATTRATNTLLGLPPNAGFSSAGIINPVRREALTQGALNSIPPAVPGTTPPITQVADSVPRAISTTPPPVAVVRDVSHIPQVATVPPAIRAAEAPRFTVAPFRASDGSATLIPRDIGGVIREFVDGGPPLGSGPAVFPPGVRGTVAFAPETGAGSGATYGLPTVGRSTPPVSEVPNFRSQIARAVAEPPPIPEGALDDLARNASESFAPMSARLLADDLDARAARALTAEAAGDFNEAAARLRTVADEIAVSGEASSAVRDSLQRAQSAVARGNALDDFARADALERGTLEEIAETGARPTGELSPPTNPETIPVLGAVTPRHLDTLAAGMRSAAEAAGNLAPAYREVADALTESAALARSGNRTEAVAAAERARRAVQDIEEIRAARSPAGALPERETVAQVGARLEESSAPAGAEQLSRGRSLVEDITAPLRITAELARNANSSVENIARGIRNYIGSMLQGTNVGRTLRPIALSLLQLTSSPGIPNAAADIFLTRVPQVVRVADTVGREAARVADTVGRGTLRTAGEFIGGTAAKADPAATLPSQLAHDGIKGIEEGGVSGYNPLRSCPSKDCGGAKTSTGELYDEQDWTAAIASDLGNKHNIAYSGQPIGYGLLEANGKKVVVKLNDVGPLYREDGSGRIADVNEQVAQYLSGQTANNFDVIPAKLTILDGTNYTPGPVADDAVLVSRAESPAGTTPAGDVSTGSVGKSSSATDAPQSGPPRSTVDLPPALQNQAIKDLAEKSAIKVFDCNGSLCDGQGRRLALADVVAEGKGQPRVISGDTSRMRFVKNPEVAPRMPTNEEFIKDLRESGITVYDLRKDYTHYTQRRSPIVGAMVHGDVHDAGRLIDDCRTAKLCYSGVFGDGSYSKTLGKNTEDGSLYLLGGVDKAPAHAYGANHRLWGYVNPKADADTDFGVPNVSQKIVDSNTKLANVAMDKYGWVFTSHGNAQKHSIGGRAAWEGGPNVLKAIFSGTPVPDPHYRLVSVDPAGQITPVSASTRLAEVDTLPTIVPAEAIPQGLRDKIPVGADVVRYPEGLYSFQNRPEALQLAKIETPPVLSEVKPIETASIPVKRPPSLVEVAGLKEVPETVPVIDAPRASLQQDPTQVIVDLSKPIVTQTIAAAEDIASGGLIIAQRALNVANGVPAQVLGYIGDVGKVAGDAMTNVVNRGVANIIGRTLEFSDAMGWMGRTVQQAPDATRVSFGEGLEQARRGGQDIPTTPAQPALRPGRLREEDLRPLSDPVDPEVVGRIAEALDEPVDSDVINRIAAALDAPVEATVVERIAAALDQPVDAAVVNRIANALDERAATALSMTDRLDAWAATQSAPEVVAPQAGWQRYARKHLWKMALWGGGLGGVLLLSGDTPTGLLPDTSGTASVVPKSDTDADFSKRFVCDASGTCKEIETGSVAPSDDKSAVTPPPSLTDRAKRAYDDLVKRYGGGDGTGGTSSGAGGGGGGAGGLMGMLQQLQGLFTGQQAGAPSTESQGEPRSPSVFRFSCDPTSLLNGGRVTISWACADNARSTGTGFDTRGIPTGSIQHAINTSSTTAEFGVSCGNSAPRMCTIQVLHPTLTLAAVPAEVESGGKARIHWAGVEVSECALVGPNGQELGRGGAIGFADTPPLTRSTEFIVVCSTKTGTPVYEYVPVTVEGDTQAPLKSTAPVGFMGAPSTSAQSGNTTSAGTGGAGTGGSTPTPTTQTGSQTTAGSQTGTGTAAPQTPPPGTYAATDANGNTVYLCNPDIGDINQVVYCLSGGIWDCAPNVACYPSTYKGGEPSHKPATST